MLPHELQRIEVLHAYDILDSGAEREFDDLVVLASQICDSPISLITLIDSDRAWYKAKKGINENESERDISFCSYAIENGGIFEIPDTTKDERFVNNPLVRGNANIKFYAGVPLVTDHGYKLGTLCVLDKKPKTLSEHQRFALETLAAQAMKLIDARAKSVALQNITKVQDKLLSIVSHDVRNPLASLKAILELWTERLISAEEADEMLAVAALQLDGAIEMITNVLNWGKLSGTISHEKKMLNLHELVQKSYHLISGKMRDKENEFVNNVPVDLLLQGNESLLQFITQNLLNNTAKFTDHGSVSVDAQHSGGNVLITIKDTGVGMDEEMVSQLFDGKKNYPLPGTAKETGNGLGLMLIKDLLVKYKGDIHVVSSPGEGTTVIITIKNQL